MDDITAGQVIVWVIIGGLAGALASRVMTLNSRGFGRFTNIVVGLIGAVIGGFLFNLLDIDLKLDELVFTAEDLFTAFIGSIIFIMLIRFIRR